MPDYRRFFVPGGTYFFTLVAYHRRHCFADPRHVQLLREAAAVVRRELPFDFLAGVVLPDHMHFIWTLPPGDSDYSKRIGRIKVQFTRSCQRRTCEATDLSISRKKHRESDIWQRRFWEHTITDEEELHAYLDYVHYNPVKHGFASCPHSWTASSFHRWVALGQYEPTWSCSCMARRPPHPNFAAIEDDTGEP